MKATFWKTGLGIVGVSLAVLAVPASGVRSAKVSFARPGQIRQWSQVLGQKTSDSGDVPAARKLSAGEAAPGKCLKDRLTPEAVRAEIGTISRQAVYNVLGALAEKGLIRRIQPSGSAALYEGRVGDNHHHVICRTCGATADVDCAVGKAPCLSASDNLGFRIDEAEVIYWGTCPECLAKT